MQRIQESEWSPISPEGLELISPVTFAMLADKFRRTQYSDLEFVHEIFGGWIETHLLGELNRRLKNAKKTASEGNKKFYVPTTREELLLYYMRQCMKALNKHKKHDIPASKLEDLKERLLGKNRTKAISACFHFPDHILETIVGTWPSYISTFIKAGSLCCLDETIFPYYGKDAFDEKNWSRSKASHGTMVYVHTPLASVFILASFQSPFLFS